MLLWQQVLIIFAGVNGYLDDLPVEWVRPFEGKFLQWLQHRYPEILHEIETTRDFSPGTEEKMHRAVVEFKETFVREMSQGQEAAA